jgi:hypothetical protein
MLEVRKGSQKQTTVAMKSSYTWIKWEVYQLDSPNAKVAWLKNLEKFC